MDNGLVHVDIETLQNYGNVLILIVVDNGLVLDAVVTDDAAAEKS